MKKILLFAFAAVAMAACNSDREYLTYRGVPMNTPLKAFTDSMTARGLVVDTSNHDKETVIMSMPEGPGKLVISAEGDSIYQIVENYDATYNDSTRNLYRTMLAKSVEEYGHQPKMPINLEDHSEARFYSDKGTFTLQLENTYTPHLSVSYETRVEKDN